MKQPVIRSLSLALILMGVWSTQIGCGSVVRGGVFEGGNPELRVVQGNVSSTDRAVSCLADTVIATDSDLMQTSATVDENCDFSLELTVNKAYSFVLYLDDTFVAKIVFQISATVTSDFVSITNDFSDTEQAPVLLLGQVVLNDDGTASLQNEPSKLQDQDRDGQSDFDDEDDDNNGIADTDESSCLQNPTLCSASITADMMGFYQPGTVSGTFCPDDPQQNVFELSIDANNVLSVNFYYKEPDNLAGTESFGAGTSVDTYTGAVNAAGVFEVTGQTIADEDSPTEVNIDCRGTVRNESNQKLLSITCDMTSPVPEISGQCVYTDFVPLAEDDDPPFDNVVDDCDNDGTSDNLDEDSSSCDAASFFFYSEITTIDLSTGEDWEGQKKVRLSFQDSVGLLTPQSIRYRYGDVTNPRMSITVGSGSSATTVIPEDGMIDDPVEKVLCGVINDIQHNVPYQAYIIGDAPGTVQVTWEDGDTCGTPWPL